MYSIRIKINHRKKELCHTDKDTVGVRLKSGRIRYMHWRGFTLDIDHPIKLEVDAFTLEYAWNPRDLTSKMAVWTELRPGEYLLGSYATDGFIYTVLPFRII